MCQLIRLLPVVVPNWHDMTYSGLMAEFEELMTPAEVAKAFRVDTKTVTRWANRHNLTVMLTPGGHRRFLRREVEEKLAPVRQVSNADKA